MFMQVNSTFLIYKQTGYTHVLQIQILPINLLQNK